MKKIILFIEAGLAIIILALGVFLLLPKKTQAPVVVTPPADIEVFSPKPNEAVVSPLKITGVVRENGWSGFEGQVGTVQVLDASGKQLAVTYLPATTEWTQLPTNFETTVTFTAVSGTSGSLVFHNENASGDPVRDKTLVVPVRFGN